MAFDPDEYLSSKPSTEFDPDAYLAATPPKPSGALRRAADYGISALKGAIAVPETAVGIADIVTGGRAGKAAEELGFRPKEAKEILTGMMTPEQQAANRAVSEAKGFIPTVVEAVKHPSTIAHTVTESVPSALTGGLVGRGVLAAAPKVAPFVAGAVGEGVVGAGLAAEQVRQQTDTGLLGAGQVAPVLASGVGATLFGALGGKLSQKFNVTDIDTLIAQGLSREAATEAVKQGMAKRIVMGGISEGVFEELPQSAQEQIWQNVALGKPAMEGVPESAAMGMLAGGVMGGGVAALAPGGRTAPDATSTAEPAPTAEPQPGETPEQAFMREQAGVKARWAEAEKKRVWDEYATKRQAVIDSQMADNEIPAPPVPHPDASPGSLSSAANVAARTSGSFKQVSELADLAATERAAKTSAVDDLLNTQAMRRESELESVGGRVVGAQEQDARAKRLALLDAAYADEKNRMPGMSFLQALEREFPNAPNPTPEEKQFIASRESARRAFRQPTTVPAAPDEGAGLGIKERAAPTTPIAAPIDAKIARARDLLAAGNRITARGTHIADRTGKPLMPITEEIRNALQEPSTYGDRAEIAGVETGGGIRQGEQGAETAAAGGVEAGRTPTVEVVKQAIDKVGPEAFQQYADDHLATFEGEELEPAETAAEIEGVARRIVDGAYDEAPTETIAELQATLSESEPFSEQHTATIDALQTKVTSEAKDSVAQGQMPVYQVTDTLSVALHPSAQNPGKIQATRYSKDGIIGDSQYNNIDEAVRQEGVWMHPRTGAEQAEKLIGESIAAEQAYQKRRVEATPAAPRQVPPSLTITLRDPATGKKKKVNARAAMKVANSRVDILRGCV